MRGTRRSAAGRLAALAVTALLAVSGCSSGAPPSAQPAARTAGAGEGLRDVCPAIVVIQTNWWPQAEYGGIFQLLGAPPVVDKGKKTVSAPLVTGGGDTGVRLEIRSGGPAVNFIQASKFLHLDSGVHLASADLDLIVRSSREQPVLGVFAPMDKSPLVLMWDPARYPQLRTVADIGRSGIKVLYYEGSIYMDYLTGSGILSASQVESAYDGTPARFVAEEGKLVQQGFLTNEVFQYQYELLQWKRKVAWTLIGDAGYPLYPETMSIRADRKNELAPCLRKLVPMMQRATVDYAASPKATNDLLVRLVKDFGAYPYSSERATAAAKALTDNAIMGNGPDTAVGNFEIARVQRIMSVLRSIAERRREPAFRAGVSPSDLVTNDFIDTSVGMRK